MEHRKMTAIVYALLAAVFYAINMPCSKLLLAYVPATLLAGFLYLGAGIGIGILFLFHHGKLERHELLGKPDMPYAIGMVVLDCFAPILLMVGLLRTTSANASLLNNFEIVATSVIAWVIFREKISRRLWCAILLVTLSSAILSLEDSSGLQFSIGSLFVLLAAVCWGFENNCTRSISSKNTYEIVTIKGIGSGLGSLILGLATGERLPAVKYILLSMLLGFVAYGLSIFFYIRAQKDLGAAKTSAYYAIAPFVGAFLSFLVLHEPLSAQYLIALVLMIFGSALVTADALALEHHKHMHTHTITHTHDGSTHTHTITHSHEHIHFAGVTSYEHTHPDSVYHHAH